MLSLACASAPGSTRADADTRLAEPVTAPLADATPTPSAATTGAPGELDARARCTQVRATVDAATDLEALQRALTAAGPALSVTPGESLTAGGKLVSFCADATPALSPVDCLAALGFERPLVMRMPRSGKPTWELHESSPSPGKELATKAPRFGPAAVFPRIAAPPRGKPQPGAPEGLPVFSLDRDRDAIIALCFVQRSIGEG